MDKNALNSDNIYTINSLVAVLQCNRRTIQKRLDRGNFPITSVRLNNRDYTGYIITKDELEKIDFEIKANKQGVVTPVKRNNDKVVKVTPVNVQSSVNQEKTDITASYTNDMLRNVTEIINQKTELENETKDLKLQITQMEKAHMLEVKELTDRYNMLAFDNKDLKNKVLMIEDKQTFVEGKVAELTQDNTRLSNTIKTKDKTIIILSAVILVFITVLSTLLIVSRWVH